MVLDNLDSMNKYGSGCVTIVTTVSVWLQYLCST